MAGVVECEAVVGDREPDAEQGRRRRMRSIAIALALGAMVVLFYLATIVHLGGNVMKRSM